MRILIVDDEPTMLNLYKRAFELEDYEVSVAEDGQIALRLLSEGLQPNVILLDIMMPKMNGLQVLEEIKQKQEYQTIPIVLLTNLAGKNDAQLGLEKGADEYLVKSETEPNEVVEIVTGIIEEKKL